MVSRPPEADAAGGSKRMKTGYVIVDIDEDQEYVLRPFPKQLRMSLFPS